MRGKIIRELWLSGGGGGLGEVGVLFYAHKNKPPCLSSQQTASFRVGQRCLIGPKTLMKTGQPLLIDLPAGELTIQYNTCMHTHTPTYLIFPDVLFRVSQMTCNTPSALTGLHTSPDTYPMLIWTQAQRSLNYVVRYKTTSHW